MKYIINEDKNSGVQSIPDEVRNNLLKAFGYEPKQEEALQESVQAEEETSYTSDTSEAPAALYEWDDSVFTLDDEVFEIEGDLYLKADEMDSNTYAKLDESHKDLFVDNVSFDENEFNLGDVFDYGDETFIKMNEEKVDHTEADNYAKSISKKFAPGMDGDMEHYAAVKKKYPKYVQPNLRKEDSAEKQIDNLDTSTPKGRERANELRRKEKAKKLDAKDAAAGKIQGNKVDRKGKPKKDVAVGTDDGGAAAAAEDAKK